MKKKVQKNEQNLDINEWLNIYAPSLTQWDFIQQLPSGFRNEISLNTLKDIYINWRKEYIKPKKS